MIVGYARVSTDGADQDISIAEQARQLREAGCDRVIAERRSAHKDGIRPGWEELLGLVAAGRVRKVVAVSQSRLSRRGEDVPFLRMCSRQGVEVVLLDGTPASTADPASKLLTGVLSLVNEIDSDIKARNVRNGLARRKAQGHYACGRVPFGYRYDGSQVAIHPEHFADARLLWQQLEEVEFNLPRVIRRHGLRWSARGLGRWIDNPILRGIVNNEAGKVEALISWQEWQRARGLLESRKRVGARAPRTLRTFSGLVRCSFCNHWLHYVVAAGKPRLKCSNLRCSHFGRGLAEWKIRAQVIEALRAAAERMAMLGAEPAPLVPSPVDDAKRQQIAQLEALQAQGVQGLEGSIEALRLELLTPPPPNSADWAGLREVLLLPGALEAATVPELRPLLHELVAELTYTGDCNRITIRLREGASGDAPNS